MAPAVKRVDEENSQQRPLTGLTSVARALRLGNHCCSALTAGAVIVTVVPLCPLVFCTVATS
jgi:hypothetical protein